MTDRYLDPPHTEVRSAVERALAEDLAPLGDLSAALVPADLQATATFVAREAGVLAGSACATETFLQVDPDVEVAWELPEGGSIEPRTAIASCLGLSHESVSRAFTRLQARSLLRVEGQARR